MFEQIYFSLFIILISQENNKKKKKEILMESLGAI